MGGLQPTTTGQYFARMADSKNATTILTEKLLAGQEPYVKKQVAAVSESRLLFPFFKINKMHKIQQFDQLLLEISDSNIYLIFSRSKFFTVSFVVYEVRI